jgi:hypothetical protein
MAIKFIYMINLILVFGILSCSKPDTIKVESHSKGLILTQAEIKELIPLLGSFKSTKSYFHVLYAEQFNDSTCLIRVYLNGPFASKKLGVCETFQSDQNKIFVYDSTRCNMKLPDSLTTTKENYLLTNDGQVWAVLAKRRKGHVEYYNLTYFNNSDDESVKDLTDPSPHLAQVLAHVMACVRLVPFLTEVL